MISLKHTWFDKLLICCLSFHFALVSPMSQSSVMMLGAWRESSMQQHCSCLYQIKLQFALISIFILAMDKMIHSDESTENDHPFLLLSAHCFWLSSHLPSLAEFFFRLTEMLQFCTTQEPQGGGWGRWFVQHFCVRLRLKAKKKSLWFKFSEGS